VVVYDYSPDGERMTFAPEHYDIALLNYLLKMIAGAISGGIMVGGVYSLVARAKQVAS
jgi:hypothetical protein